MGDLEAERDTLERFLAATTSPEELAGAGRRLKAVNEELHSVEERWLSISQELEALR
jgi:ATP-binding cassette subfamily F protein 3